VAQNNRLAGDSRLVRTDFSATRVNRRYTQVEVLHLENDFFYSIVYGALRDLAPNLPREPFRIGEHARG
jgi:hypothetical protein